MKREIGIDLSSHNSNINVSALLAIEPNYAIIKVSEGLVRIALPSVQNV